MDIDIAGRVHLAYDIRIDLQFACLFLGMDAYTTNHNRFDSTRVDKIVSSVILSSFRLSFEWIMDDGLVVDDPVVVYDCRKAAFLEESMEATCLHHLDCCLPSNCPNRLR